MVSRYFSGFFIVFLFAILLFSCTKFDTTTIGSDVLPEVDNVNTFADTLDVNSSNNAAFVDSTTLNREFYHALGRINNDPIFGTSNANVFLQLKPTFYPYRLELNDTLVGLDSVVLTLSYKGTWGDSTLAQQIEVRKVDDLNFRDSPTVDRKISYSPNYTSLLGSATIVPSSLRNKQYIRNGKDSVVNQIRIKITNPAYINALYTSDTSLSGSNNAFRNDSAFRRLYNGIALIANNSTGNGLMYLDLTSNLTRLEIHYRTKNGPSKDTVQSNLRLSRSPGSLFPSATANNIVRNRPAFSSGIYSYLQTSPGTSIDLNIPRLNTYKDTNKIIHRAYLEFKQATDNPIFDSIFSPPTFIYVDLKDTGSTNLKYKPLYVDLNPNLPYNPDATAGFFPFTIDQLYYGARLKYKFENSLGRYASYSINVSRYLQRMLVNRDINYQLRLRAPYSLLYPQYSPFPIDYANQIAFGRVRLASGSHPDSRLRMKLIVIYSKIK